MEAAPLSTPSAQGQPWIYKPKQEKPPTQEDNFFEFLPPEIRSTVETLADRIHYFENRLRGEYVDPKLKSDEINELTRIYEKLLIFYERAKRFELQENRHKLEVCIRLADERLKELPKL